MLVKSTVVIHCT